MKRFTVPVRLSNGRSHSIKVGGDLAALGGELAKMGFRGRAVVVSVRGVARLFAGPLLAGLRRVSLSPHLVLMPDGESAKTLGTVESLYSKFLSAGLDRKGLVIALGGGVVGDAAGFAAATYMRGVPLVQCPTTLLAMVDSSIGGKTAVDLPEGKNLAGAFWQPRLIWMDPSVLKTLPDRQWKTGMAEVIKYGLIRDAALIPKLEKTDLRELKISPKLQAELVVRSARIKADVVSRDEHETKGLREILNLGHTFGHAIEAVAGYGFYTHGEAIAVGMCAAGRLGRALGLVSGDYVPRIEALFRRWGLPVRLTRPLRRAAILKAMSRDKKNRDGVFRFILPTGFGRVRAVGGVPLPVLNRILSEVGIS